MHQAEGSRSSMSSTPTKDPDVLGRNVLSVALIGPDAQRREPIASALARLQGSVTREFTAYPELDDVPRLLEAEYDVIILDLDSNTEHALDLVEDICGKSSVTVMVYSAQIDPEMLVRCMRAGAREFLTQPATPKTIAEAMIRASVRRPASAITKKALGDLLVFVGAKGHEPCHISRPGVWQEHGVDRSQSPSRGCGPRARGYCAVLNRECS
jgi:pilus assembly protein CpaE